MGSDPPLDNARWGLQLPGHSGVPGSRMAWTWAGSRGSTNQYKVVHACNGELGVCLDTWGM